MDGLPVALLMLRLLHTALLAAHLHDGDRACQGANEDLESAYRQVALLTAQLCLSVSGVWDTDDQCLSLHEMCGQPFGEEHAVPIVFLRVAEWLSRALRRQLH